MRLQLLCHLDGVEGRTGVYVLAATSRPDMIDAALMRPGRLDKLLLCDFPDADERLDILQAVARKMRLAPDVDLRAVAAQCANFSGADLQAVLTTAQLSAIHDQLDALTSAVSASSSSSSSSSASSSLSSSASASSSAASASASSSASSSAASSSASPPALLVTRAHVAAACAAARLSISAADRARFAAIYAEFAGSRKATASGGEARPTALGSRTAVA